MKKFLLGTAAVIALAVATPAAAGDLGARMPMKAPPMVASVWNWTGFYVGINGGYGGGRVRWDALPFSYDVDGGTIGGQIGYNSQFGNFVLGLEAQGNWADFHGSRVIAPFTIRTQADAFGLFTGKVGYAWNTFMIYGTGGMAVQSIDHRWSATAANFVASGNASETRWGATAGAGLEYAFTPNISAGIQYNHLFTGRHDVVGFDRVRLNSDVFTGRVNFRFGGPVVTRY